MTIASDDAASMPRDPAGSAFPEEAGLIVLRHAAREPITSAEVAAALAAALTDEGRTMARRLGERLPARRLRLFWSPVARCRETAELIAAGAREAGLEPDLVGARDFLGALYVVDAEAITQRFARLGQQGFLQAWLGGNIPASIIESPRVAGQKLLAALLAERLPGRSAALDLHVTHDLTLLTLLTVVWDVLGPGFPWPGYLDGLALEERDGALRWSYAGRQGRSSVDGRDQERR